MGNDKKALTVDSYWNCDTPEYTNRIELGRRTASELKLVICGLVRDCELYLPETFINMNQTGHFFKKWSGALFENDSKDRSVELVEKWSASDPNFVARSEIRGERSWPMKRLAERGTAMAVYRNLCRDLVLKNFSDFDIVMVVDTDLAGWSLNGILHSLSYWGEWDVMASNGLRQDRKEWVQYDAWAIRWDSWEPRSFHNVKRGVHPVGSPLIRVWSAFGGLALYTMEAFKAAEYGGGDIEHVVFHRNLRQAGFDRAFMNPSQKTVVSWR